MAFQLVIQKGLEVGREYNFAQPEVTLGRHSEGDVVLMEAGVSRQHARIVEEKGKFFVEDLGSANGTKLNGTRVEGRAELKAGDAVSLGPVILEFKLAQSTQLVSLEELERLRNERKKAAKKDAFADEIRTMSIGSINELKAKMMEGEEERTDPGPVPPPAKAPSGSRPPSGRTGAIPALARDAQASPAKDSRPGATGARPAIAARTGAAPAVKPPEPAEPPQLPPEDSNATRMVAAPSYAPPAARDDGTRKVAVPPPGERPRSGSIKLEEKPRSGSIKVEEKPKSGGVKLARQLVDNVDEAEIPTAVPQVPPEESAPGEGGLSAAEKARLRRQYGDTLGGQIQFVWAQLSKKQKKIAAVSILAVLTAILLPVYLILRPDPVVEAKLLVEAEELTQKPTEGVFGYGPGVDFERRDMKAFRFSFVTPTRAVAVLRFMAIDIGQNEVSLTVNGAESGFVAADTPESSQREQMVVLPTTVLKRNEINELIFDSLPNPPGTDPWRIWNLSIEVIPLPEMSQRDLLNAAQEAVARAKEFYEQREVGADNRFRAWKGYRHAWITLEALGEKPELYGIVRYQLESIGKELDQQCGKMILSGERAVKMRQHKRALQAFEEVARYFPTAEHRCHNLAKYKIVEHQLYDFF